MLIFKKRIVILLVLSFIMSFFGISNTCLAYSAQNAATYAEQWALSRNSNYPSFTEDCTNFASQALYAGGRPMLYGSTEDTKWYVRKILFVWDYTLSWSMASYFYNFLGSNSAPLQGSWTTSSAPGNDKSEIIKGDVLSYDWDGGGSKDHSAIVTYMGYDPNSSNFGDLVCYHSKDRYRGIWHLRPYNANYMTTIVYDRRPS
ncbi:MAG: amidase domain-containing protein [Desulfitobacteriaceae bacterium]